MTTTNDPINDRVVVYFGKDGGIQVASDRAVTVFYVDESVPCDRVYRFQESYILKGHSIVDAILGNSPIGHAGETDEDLARREAFYGGTRKNSTRGTAKRSTKLRVSGA